MNPDDQEGYGGFLAASKFFDINIFAAYFLFDPMDYNVPNDKQNGKPMIDRVVKRIDWLLETYDSNTTLWEQLSPLTVKDKRHLSIGDD